MLTPKVRILLDVDGVLNSVGDHKGSRFKGWPQESWSRAEVDHVEAGRIFVIRWSSHVADFIRRMYSTDGVEVLWLTTWEDTANKYISPLLGLPQFEVGGRDEDGIVGTGLVVSAHDDVWWKWPCAQRLWEQDGIPFVWIDDDLGTHYTKDATEWLQGIIAEGQALGISPDQRKALTPALLERIEEFVQERLA